MLTEHSGDGGDKALQHIRDNLQEQDQYEFGPLKPQKKNKENIPVYKKLPTIRCCLICSTRVSILAGIEVRNTHIPNPLGKDSLFLLSAAAGTVS